MLSQYISQVLTLIKRLLLIYLIYFFCRLLFYFFNHRFFSDLSFFEFIRINLWALRFDTFSIIVSNSLFIFLSILPFNFTNSKKYQKTLLWIFVIFNLVFLLFNLVDIAYYGFIRKRSTFDVLKLAGGQVSLMRLLPGYIKDFWYILVFLICAVFWLPKFYKKIGLKAVHYVFNVKDAMMLSLCFLVLCSLAVIGVRGGTQLIPIDVVDAAKYTTPQNISLVLNSPFTIIKSMEKDELNKLHFDFKSNELKRIYDPIHVFKTDTFHKQNVVIIILESFSKEFTKLSRLNSFTPFLDSLMEQSLTFTSAFANGHKSIEGIPAILSSMPSLMENPLINSAYADDVYPSIASILRQEGYATAFFHGGMNGTMNFDSYAAQTGYTHYYGMNEYHNDKDYDGCWGIWDEPFYNYAIKIMNQLKEPFHSAIFSLSSHHPYLIPDKYKDKFPKGEHDYQENIGYADYALRKFFDEAKKQKWFKNTLFVLTADHCGISNDPFYSNIFGQFSIPILFYKPDNSMKGVFDNVFQQTDILPSVLDYLGYHKPFFSFGNSYKINSPKYAFYYTTSNHFMVSDTFLFTFNNYELKSAYNYRSDSALSLNLFPNRAFNKENRYFKAFIETYNNCLINNTCVAK